jgi:hypothetical protein
MIYERNLTKLEEKIANEKNGRKPVKIAWVVEKVATAEF